MIKTILGVDPGVAATGYGLIKVNGQNLETLTYGCIKTSAQQIFSQRLFLIYKSLTKLIKKYRPDLIAVEEVFFYKNVKTALQVGQARGVILLTARILRVPACEFTPLQVKQALTGYGRADKMQIQKMVQCILKLKKLPQPDDAADALAVAVCAVPAVKKIASPAI